MTNHLTLVCTFSKELNENDIVAGFLIMEGFDSLIVVRLFVIFDLS